MKIFSAIKSKFNKYTVSYYVIATLFILSLIIYFLDCKDIVSHDVCGLLLGLFVHFSFINVIYSLYFIAKKFKLTFIIIVILSILSIFLFMQMIENTEEPYKPHYCASAICDCEMGELCDCKYINDDGSVKIVQCTVKASSNK